MRAALLILAGLLMVGSLVGLVVYEVQHFATALADTRADLNKATTANKTQADALVQLRADRDQDAAQVSALVQKLQSISAEQTAQRTAFAKVLSNATPADKAVLGSHLPAAVVQLFPRSAGAAATGASSAAVRP